MNVKSGPCPEVLTPYEKLTLPTYVIQNFNDQNPRRQSDILELYASMEVIKKIMGEEYIYKRIEGIRERSPHLTTFERILDSNDKFDRLKVSHLAHVLQGIWCMDGFRQKLAIFKHRNVDFYSIQYEFEMAFLFTKHQYKVKFIINKAQEKCPDFEVYENQVRIGCECKFNKYINQSDNNKMIDKIMKKIRIAQKQIKTYSSSFIFLGGFFSEERYNEIQNDLEEKIIQYYRRHPEINSIIITPIETNILSEIKAIHLRINDFWIDNPNPNNDLSSLIHRFKYQESDRVISASILGDIHPFPTPLVNIDLVDSRK